MKPFMIRYFKDTNGMHHIGLFNYANKFCYLISAIQRLQCSPTFVQQCNTIDKIDMEKVMNSNDKWKQLLYPSILYANFHKEMCDTKDNNAIDDICLRYYTLLKQYIAWMSTAIISEKANDGYDTTHTIVYFLLPAVHKMFREHFLKILYELSINIVDFAPTLTTAQDVIQTDDGTFIRDKSFREEICKQYIEMRNLIGNGSNDSAPFIACSLDVFPNKDMLGGHAVTLILGYGIYTDKSDSSPEFYVFDDQNSITKLQIYYKQRVGKIYKIYIRDIDEKTIVLINELLHKECGAQVNHSFVKNVGKYCLNFSSNFASPNIEVIKEEVTEHIKNNPSLSGGFVNQHWMTYVLKIMSVICFCIFIGCIIYFINEERGKYVTLSNFVDKLLLKA